MKWSFVSRYWIKVCHSLCIGIIYMIYYTEYDMFKVNVLITGRFAGWICVGVFCNTAIESANADKDIAVIKQLQKQASHVEALRKIFEETLGLEWQGLGQGMVCVLVNG